MSKSTSESRDGEFSADLVVSRRIRASAQTLFDAWTRPEHLLLWWGPEGVECSSAEVDLRVGGAYRIANRFSDGSVVWIEGVYELIEPPYRLVYTWKLGSQDNPTERVTVRFDPDGTTTEVVVIHQRITSAQSREGHERGWVGCLDALASYADAL
ncbi:MAG: SRPBCC domain-containing protein [Burkholderiaceae bacterium]|jgi:uncharacterized protein YndB with AHSA1/START domain